MWAKQHDEVNQIIEGYYNPIKEWHPDPKGYFLIRVNYKDKQIEAAYVTNKHAIKKIIFGKTAQEVYTPIIKMKLVSKLDHAAYLGKELAKAEICLKKKLKYVQEGNVTFSKP
ncbi:MAG: DUF4346 domain-containing protein [archaeon]|nr:DUF4346 domain-containing protein [archaeon]